MGTASISTIATIVSACTRILNVPLIRCAALFVTYLPTPLVLLTDDQGHQNVHIAPEAFTVATAEFGDEMNVWQDALPGPLQGQLESVSLASSHISLIS